MKYGVPPEGWDQLLEKRQGSFLQSRPWAQFQSEVGAEVVWDEGDGWQWLAKLRRSKGLSYLLCAYGPVADNQTAMGQAIGSLKAAAATLNADFVRLEPQRGIEHQSLSKLGARSIHELDPEYTSVIDLRKSEEELRGALNSGHRNLINGTERRGISVRLGSDADLPAFLEMLHETAARSGVRFHPDDYFRTMNATLGREGVAKLYVTEAQGQPVAAALFYDWDGVRYYAHAGAHQELNRKLNASVSLVWQAILDAKQAGLKTFDLWGVAPVGDEHHHLANLSRFKHGFGGEQLRYLGTWDLPVRGWKYGLYLLYRRLRGMD